MILDPDEYRRSEAARRDAEIIYEERLSAARAARAAEWPEKRREIMRARYAAEDAAKARGEDVFFAVPPPPLDPPDWFLADVRVPDVPVRQPQPGEGEAGAVIAGGVDLLGRPIERLLAPEEAFQRAAREREGIGAKVKRAAGWSS